MSGLNGRREQQKEARRRLLLDLAKQLLEEDAFTMRVLAERAQVADATPYNLFGSKTALLRALYKDCWEGYGAEVRKLKPDKGFERVLLGIDLFAADLEARPEFFRSLYSAMLDPAEPYEPDPEPGALFWMRLIEELAHPGGPLPPAEAELFAREYVYLSVGATLDWLAGRLSAAEWRRVATHGFASLAAPLFEGTQLRSLDNLRRMNAATETRTL